MSKRTYEEYRSKGCLPTGYNKPCDSYIFSQATVDLLLNKIAELEQFKGGD